MISCCVIVRNGESTIGRCLESVRSHVDEIVVVDTGSTDKTLEIVGKYADKVETYLGPRDDWNTLPHIDDFAAARNRSFALATGDWVLWIDADDTLKGGELLRELVADDSADVWFLHYTYASDDQGHVFCELYRERLLRRSVITGWQGEIHETLSFAPQSRVKTDMRVDVVHKPQGERTSLDRNLTILQRVLDREGEKVSPRILYYLGREYRSRDPRKALEFLERVVPRLDSWPEERYQAAHMAADMYRTVGDYANAARLDGWAIALLPEWGDAYFGLAQNAYFQQQWERCLEFTKMGQARGVPKTSAIINPLDYRWEPLIFENVALSRLNRVDEAIASCEAGLAIMFHPNLEYNKNLLFRHKEVERVRADTRAMIDHYRRYDEWVKLDKFLAAVPHVVEDDALVVTAQEIVAKQFALLRDPLAYERFYGQGDVFPWKLSYDDVGKYLARVAWAEEMFTRTGAKTLLDCGAADGFAAIYLAKKGFTVHAIEVNPKSVAVGREAAEKEGVADQVIWHTKWVENFTLPDGIQADGAYCYETLEHVMEPARVVDRIERFVRPGGTILLCVPHGEWEPNPKTLTESVPSHLRAFTERSMRDLLRDKHFVETRVHSSGNVALPHQGHLWASFVHRPPVDIIIPTVLNDPKIEWCRNRLHDDLRQEPGVNILEVTGGGTFEEKINVGIAQSNSPYILLLNDDVWMPNVSSLLERMRHHFVQNPKLGLLGVYSNCDLGWHHHDHPCGLGITPSLDDVRSRIAEINTEDTARGNTYRDTPPTEIPWAAFYCVMISRKVWDEVGELDEHFTNFVQDVDYCERIKQAGYEIRYALNGLVIHFGGTTHSEHSVMLVKRQKRDSKRWAAQKANMPSISIVCPLEWSPWSPRVHRTKGLGGSETAVVRMVQELHREGHRVSVFNQNDGEGWYGGVPYIAYQKFNPQDPGAVVIAWRCPELVDAGEIGKQRYLWAHDWDTGDRLTETRAERFTAIFVLSEAHKEHMLERYPFLDPEHLWITRNGMDASLFTPHEANGPIARPNRLIYASSPDRGLDNVLTVFTQIRARVPDATLHVFYGWEGYDRMAVHYPQMREYKAKVLSLLDQPGVVVRGSVVQTQLALEFLQSNVWLYATAFTETSCQNAMLAQMGGAIPITRPLAALKETVKHGILIEGDVVDPEIQARYVEETVALLQNPERQAEIREPMMKDARTRFAWEPVAREWSHWFLGGASKS